MPLKVSVVVPIHNGEKYLERCIASIASQSYRNLEVILVDDGSTDASGAICDAAQAIDPRIRVIHKPNSGVSDSRNLGIAQCSGDYVRFLDCDDFLEPGMIQSLAEFAEDGFPSMVLGGFISEDPRTGVRAVASYTEALRCIDRSAFLDRYCALYLLGLVQRVWNSLYRLDVLRRNHVSFDVDLDYGEDTLFNLNYISAADTFSLSPKPAYVYSSPEQDEAKRLSSRPRADTYSRRRALHDNIVATFSAAGSSPRAIECMEREYVRRLVTTMPWRLAKDYTIGDYAAYKSEANTIRADDTLRRYYRESFDDSILRSWLWFLFRHEADLGVLAVVRVGSRVRRSLCRLPVFDRIRTISVGRAPQ